MNWMLFGAEESWGRRSRPVSAGSTDQHTTSTQIHINYRDSFFKVTEYSLYQLYCLLNAPPGQGRGALLYACQLGACGVCGGAAM
jgi:hypothetical protein